jgi:hypothetical protein
VRNGWDAGRFMIEKICLISLLVSGIAGFCLWRLYKSRVGARVCIDPVKVIENLKRMAEEKDNQGENKNG